MRGYQRTAQLRRLEDLQRRCEIIGVIFVLSLVIYMVHAGVVLMGVSIVLGVLFVASIVLIQLQMYREGFGRSRI